MTRLFVALVHVTFAVIAFEAGQAAARVVVQLIFFTSSRIEAG